MLKRFFGVCLLVFTTGMHFLPSSTQVQAVSTLEYQLLFTWDNENVTTNRWIEVWVTSANQTERQSTIVVTDSSPMGVTSSCHVVSQSSNDIISIIAYPNNYNSYPQQLIDDLSLQVRFVQDIRNCTHQASLTDGNLECSFNQSSVTMPPPTAQEVLELEGTKVSRITDGALIKFSLNAWGENSSILHSYSSTVDAIEQNATVEFPDSDLVCLKRGSISFPSDANFLTHAGNFISFKSQQPWDEIVNYYENLFGSQWEVFPSGSNGLQFYSPDDSCLVRLQSDAQLGAYSLILDDTRMSIKAIQEQIGNNNSMVITASATEPGSQVEHGSIRQVADRYINAITAELWSQRPELSQINERSAYLVFERSNQHIYVLMEDLGGEQIQVIVQRNPVAVCGEDFDVS